MVFQDSRSSPTSAPSIRSRSRRGRGGVTAARSLLDRVGLRHRAGARLDELSGGERQRIAPARALAQKPKLILMDEPFASLDDEKRIEMRELLRSLIENAETTLILVTHSRDDAFDLARRVIVLDHGRPVAADMLETLVIDPRHAAAVRALGLGALIPGVVDPRGEADTAYGKVTIRRGTRPGPAVLLVRPDRPQLAVESSGVEAEVLAAELRPSEGCEVRRVAVVRAGRKYPPGVQPWARRFCRRPRSGANRRECNPVRGHDSSQRSDPTSGSKADET